MSTDLEFLSEDGFAPEDALQLHPAPIEFSKSAPDTEGMSFDLSEANMTKKEKKINVIEDGRIGKWTAAGLF